MPSVFYSQLTDKYIKTVSLYVYMEFLLKEWQETWVPPLKERSIGLDILPENIRKILTFSGIRRGGKTYVMFQLISHLSEKYPKESIFYVNFEDERIEKTTENLTKLIPTLIKLYGERNYFLFLDEVQVMPEWGRWLRRVSDSYRNIAFFVSGSSSKLSSREIPTELRGRALNSEIFPLSFKEFLGFKGFSLEPNFQYSERQASLVENLFAEYITFGGFPEVSLVDSESTKRKLIQEYFKTIVLKDIAERNKIKKIELLEDFLRLMLNTKIFSVNKTYNTIKSQGKKAGKETLIKYTKCCEDAYFCFFVPVLSYKIKDQMQYPKKVYFADTGFITCLSLRFMKDMGRLYENAVFLWLKNNPSKKDREIFYWLSSQKEEVDFVVKEGTEVAQLIQVCYDIEDYDTKKRETKALIKAAEELECKNLLIITEKKEGLETINGHQITYIPLWKWLLEAEKIEK